MDAYYSILGVEYSSTQEEIKKNYRELAKQYHPDKESGDLEKMKQINNAHTAY